MEIWQKCALENIASRLALGLSQTELATKAKISYQHANAVLNGHRPVTRQFVQSISPFLGKSTDWFYQDHSKEVEPVPACVSASAIKGPLTVKDCAVILSQLADISPERRALVLAILFDDASVIPDSMSDVGGDLSQLLSTIG